MSTQLDELPVLDFDADFVVDPEPSPARRRGRAVAEWLAIALLVFLVSFAVRTLCFGQYGALGISMEPTVHDGDRVLVNRLAYKLGDPEHSDVIVIAMPIERGGKIEDVDIVKRVIGLPGETVRIHDCTLYIDDVATPEPYLSDEVLANRSWCEFGPMSVPDDHVLVMGDNRPVSLDSRKFGPVHESKIDGRVAIIFFPRISTP